MKKSSNSKIQNVSIFGFQNNFAPTYLWIYSDFFIKNFLLIIKMNLVLIRFDII